MYSRGLSFAGLGANKPMNNTSFNSHRTLQQQIQPRIGTAGLGPQYYQPLLDENHRPVDEEELGRFLRSEVNEPDHSLFAQEPLDGISLGYQNPSANQQRNAQEIHATLVPTKTEPYRNQSFPTFQIPLYEGGRENSSDVTRNFVRNESSGYQYEQTYHGYPDSYLGNNAIGNWPQKNNLQGNGSKWNAQPQKAPQGNSYPEYGSQGFGFQGNEYPANGFQGIGYLDNVYPANQIQGTNFRDSWRQQLQSNFPTAEQIQQLQYQDNLAYDPPCNKSPKLNPRHSMFQEPRAIGYNYDLSHGGATFQFHEYEGSQSSGLQSYGVYGDSVDDAIPEVDLTEKEPRGIVGEGGWVDLAVLPRIPSRELGFRNRQPAPPRNPLIEPNFQYPTLPRDEFDYIIPIVPSSPNYEGMNIKNSDFQNTLYNSPDSKEQEEQVEADGYEDQDNDDGFGLDDEEGGSEEERIASSTTEKGKSQSSRNRPTNSTASPSSQSYNPLTGKRKALTRQERKARVKGIPGSDGITSAGEVRTLADGSLVWKSGTGWVPAVYHNTIRPRLIQEMASVGSYDNPRACGRGEWDITSYHPPHKTWGPSRVNDWPYMPGKLLFRLERKGYPVPTYKPPIWHDKGRVVLDGDNMPLKKYHNMPLTLSSQVEGYLIEQMRREDIRISRKDICARMPLQKVNSKGNLVRGAGLTAIGMRSTRFRMEQACVAWTKREGTDTICDYIKGLLSKEGLEANSTEELPGLTPRQQAEAKRPNKGKYLSRAGPRALSPQTRLERDQLDEARLNRLDANSTGVKRKRDSREYSGLGPSTIQGQESLEFATLRVDDQTVPAPKKMRTQSMPVLGNDLAGPSRLHGHESGGAGGGNSRPLQFDAQSHQSFLPLLTTSQTYLPMNNSSPGDIGYRSHSSGSFVEDPLSRQENLDSQLSQQFRRTGGNEERHELNEHTNNYTINPPEGAVDYRYVRPNTDEEIELVSQALVNTWMEFSNLSGRIASNTPSHESYAVQYDLLEQEFSRIWRGQGPPPRLTNVGPWKDGFHSCPDLYYVDIFGGL